MNVMYKEEFEASGKNRLQINTQQIKIHHVLIQESKT